ncbi:MAG TPA: branched-chain amino acid ABC transporter ATP-binding protein/permease [Micromonosporaceae bacterium]|jgi:branched-chain amino acid transport system permease protein
MTAPARAVRGGLPRGLLILVATNAVIGVLGLLSQHLGVTEYNVVLVSTVLFWATQATSWNILSGFAGYFSFGQGAFYGVGVYSMAVLTGRHGVNYLLSIPVGGLVGGALAVLIGAVAFRLRSLRGEIFALLTLAVPFILSAIALNSQAIDGGVGQSLPTPSFPHWVPNFQHLVFLLNLVVATIAFAVALAVHRSRVGRGLAALHDAEDAAEVLGVPTFRYKMLAIVLGGVLGGMGGAVWAVGHYVIVDSVFNLYFPLLVILICIAGGRRHWLGPVIGAVLLVVLQEWLTASNLGNHRDIVLGVLLVAIVVFAPAGLFQRLRAHPWLALGVFLVVFISLVASGFYADLDALLYGMIAAVIVAIVAGAPAIARRLPSGRAASPTPAPTALPGTGAAAGAPAQTVRASSAVPQRAAQRGGGRVLVSIRGVSKNFGGVRALENVSFEVAEGEIVGLVGPNGSGKTTLVNLLSGAMPPDGGTIFIDGRSIKGLAAHKVAHAGVARTYQIPKPFASMTVLDNVAMAVMFGRTGASLPEAREHARRHLTTVHLGHLAESPPASLNLHQRQLLEMARAIAAEPSVLVLDEALAGLNPAEIDDAVAVIQRIHAAGISIIIVEHLLRVLQQLATRIVVLNRGALIADGAPAQVLNDPTVVHAYLGRQRA